MIATTISKTTVVYKKTNDFEIKGDFYSTEKQANPVIVFIHGGGLFWGSREDMRAEQIDFFNQAGFNIFSIDYRLAPETKLPEIKSDLVDALAWLENDGLKQFHYNPEKVVVMGSSAGGFLALLTGTLQKKPQAIVSFYGYGDITGDWAKKPSPHYQKMTTVPKDLAKMLVTNKPLSIGPIEKRYAIYMYARQTGEWIEEISGLIKGDLSEFCPINYADAQFPPTILLHGTMDEDVPYEQSVLMSETLTKAGVDNQLITIPNGKHVFDEDWQNPVVKKAFDEVLHFLRKHLL